MEKVSFVIPKNENEYKFVEECFYNERFIKYIRIGWEAMKDVHLIKMENKNMGLIVFNIYESGSLKKAEPIIFLMNSTKYTQKIFINIFFDLFKVKKIDVLIIKVYSINFIMENLLKRFEFKYCGKIKNIQKDIDVSYFYCDRVLHEYMVGCYDNYKY
ncbi:hypothetical protein [Carnobacterium sp. FSL E2-0243]|uniref:hypothetical protein n=1 Tax=Carnobacterium sp. FSL E2-0243 TaxID=2921365 RepID=UPI0030FC7EE9